jgi:y4mF family transcriptional regulator
MNHITTVRDLGGLVKAQRKRLKLNQKALAGLVGVGNRFIVELERGKETIEFGKTLHVLRMLGISLTAESIKDD